VAANNLTKTNTTSAWNAGASSTNVIHDGSGYVETTVTETNTERMIGLSSGDTDQNYPDIDFAIYLNSNATVQVYEAGAGRGSYGTYASGDRLRVEVRYGVVRYLRNGTVLYSSSAIPKYPLRVDTSLKSPNSTLTNVRVGNLVWTNLTGVSMAGDTITKTGASGWNAGACSSNTIESGDGFFEFTATETNTNRAAGFGSTDTGQTLADLKFGVVLHSDGSVEVSESGTSRGLFGTYLSGDIFRVELTAGTMRYYQNGTNFYTSTVTPVYPLRADSSLDTTGATITKLSLETLVWSSSAGVAQQGASLTKTAATGNWDAQATSTNFVSSGDGWVEFTAIETTSRRVLGLKGIGSSQTYADIDFAIDLTDTGIVQVQELGTLRGQFGSYVNGDRLRIEIQDGIVRYRKNGTILYTSAVIPSYPLHVEASLYTNGATLVGVATGDLVWINETRVQVFGRSFLSNTPGGWAWDAGAVSTKQINSGYMEFTATDPTTWRIAGLGHNDTNQDYADVDFGIMLYYQFSQSRFSVYESGSNRSLGWFSAGDRFRVALENGTVKYYQNGSLVYSSTVSPILPLRVDTAAAGNGTGIFNVVLSGTPVAGQLDMPTVSPGGGQYTTTQTVTMSHWLSTTTIRYTTDGTDPTESSTLYTAPIVVDLTSTIKAKAWKSIYTSSNVRTAVYTMKVGTPTFSVAAGTYNTTRTVTISTVTFGAIIRYTLDGSTPSDSSPLYSAPITVDQTLTLKAKGARTGWTDSDIATATYTMKVGALTLTPAPGSYSGVQTVTLTTVTPNVTFRYTIDGNELSSSSPTLTGNTVTIDHSLFLKIQGFRAGWSDSDVSRGNYFVNLGTVATPTLSPAPGTFTEAKTITISTTTPDATIRYTTDGTEPSIRSRIYAGPIAFSNTTEIQAKAFKLDMTMSATSNGLYVMETGAVDTPRLRPGSGMYPTFQSVTVICETPGSTIHYTTNGSEPTESDPVVASGGTVTVNQSMTLKAKAWKDGIAPSSIGRTVYLITGAVGAGESHSLAVKPDGTVWTWGWNSLGQLGRPPINVNSPTPAQVGITDVVAVAGARWHSLALKRDGTVWSWGNNYDGELGNGTTGPPQLSPVQASGLTDVIGIGAGVSFSVALKRDGTVWAWGIINDISLGINYGTSPSQIPGLSGIAQISANQNTIFALKTDGAAAGIIWSWGVNRYGILGDGTFSNRATPVPVVGMTDVIMVAGGGADRHAVAVRNDGTIWTWGDNPWGQLGDGTSTARQKPGPAFVPFPNRVISLTAGSGFSLAVQRPPTGGSITWAWGLNDVGRLGDGTTSTASTPVRNLVSDAVMVAAQNGAHALAVSSDARVWAWGSNGSGQIGDGTTTNRPTPIAVPGFTAVDSSPWTGDPDGDGLPTWLELELGTDPWNADTNGDGIPDGVALNSGISATQFDIDSDGLTNATELARGTDPFRADTDGDGINDGADCFPLDPSQSQCPAPVPGDTTPPNITLTEPTNASLVGSVP
jgi:alpha-tubulin suppressor-like RCC1 family protein